MKVFEISQDWGMENLVKVERDTPVPQRGEVLVRMRMASLNARDLIVPERGYGRATGSLPLVPVSDGVGYVAAVGDGVENFEIDDRVCPTFFQSWDSGAPGRTELASSLGGPLDGVMAEYVCLNSRGVVRVPAYLSDGEAAALPCAGVTAWSAIATLGETQPGDKILIQGTGSIGLFALTFAKMHGAETTLISGSSEKLDYASKLGVDHCINTSEVDDWARASRELTQDRGGFDNVIDVGGEETLPLSLRAVRPGGTISMIGVLSGLSLEASVGKIVSRQIRLQGVTVGHREGFQNMLSAMAYHESHVALGKIFAFDDLKAGLAHLKERNRFGKTLVQF